MDWDKVGGPAFPHQSTDYQGMSLLDHFATHAPAAPSWYDYEAPGKPKFPNESHLSSEQIARINDIRDGVERWFAGSEDAAILIPATKRRIAFNEARNAWQERNEAERFFAWRWHYAQMMLRWRDEITEGKGDEDDCVSKEEEDA